MSSQRSRRWCEWLNYSMDQCFKTRAILHGCARCWHDTGLGTCDVRNLYETCQAPSSLSTIEKVPFPSDNFWQIETAWQQHRLIISIFFKKLAQQPRNRPQDFLFFIMRSIYVAPRFIGFVYSCRQAVPTSLVMRTLPRLCQLPGRAARGRLACLSTHGIKKYGYIRGLLDQDQ